MDELDAGLHLLDLDLGAVHVLLVDADLRGHGDAHVLHLAHLALLQLAPRVLQVLLLLPQDGLLLRDERVLP